MASIRSLSTRAKLLTLRYHPSITHIHHHHDDDIKHYRIPSLQGTNYFLPQRPFGIGFLNSSVLIGFIQNRRCLDVPLSPRNLGLSFFRCISTTAGDDEPEKINLMTEIADILNETSVQVHTPAANEVAVAAADSFFPVAFFQHCIDAVHSFTGFNWWASIIVTTLMIRGALLPLHINGLKDLRKVVLLLPHALKEMKRVEDTDLDFMVYSKDFKVLNEFFKNLFRLLSGILIRASVHVCFFMGILNMAEKVPSFFGGAYWLLDLSTPDSLFIFPFLTAMLILMTTEGHAKQEFYKRIREARQARNVLRAVAIISVPCTMDLPKAVFCYWITSELFCIAFSQAVKLYGVKKFYGIPEKPSEKQQN